MEVRDGAILKTKDDLIGYFLGEPIYPEDLYKYTKKWFLKQYNNLTDKEIKRKNTLLMDEIRQLDMTSKPMIIEPSYLTDRKR